VTIGIAGSSPGADLLVGIESRVLVSAPAYLSGRAAMVRKRGKLPGR
jgi:hypothetical protein